MRGSWQLKGRKAALVLVAVEKRGRATGRARMAVIPDFKSTTLIAFLKQNVAPGSTIYIDGLKSFTGLGGEVLCPGANLQLGPFCGDRLDFDLTLYAPALMWRDGFVEGKTRFRTVPVDEFTDSVIVER